MTLPEQVITDADWQTVLEVGAVALHKSDHDAGCPRHEHADRLEGCRTIAEEVLDAAMPVIWRIAAATERERIRQLAVAHGAHYHSCGVPCSAEHSECPFAGPDRG